MMRSIGPKIIGVGFQKTGTSTLRESLKLLGYKVGDNMPRLLIPALRGNYDRILRKISHYDAVEDNPWPLLYKELDQRIPGCRFILTIREEESWYKSVSNHIGDLKNPMHEWIYGRGKGLPKDNKENTIRTYREHNEGVIEYFKDRPDDLLVIDFTKGDGWDKLCEFLGHEKPVENLPHYNKATYKKPKKVSIAKRFKKGRKRLKHKLKIWYIDQKNLWPSN